MGVIVDNIIGDSSYQDISLPNKNLEKINKLLLKFQLFDKRLYILQKHLICFAFCISILKCFLT